MTKQKTQRIIEGQYSEIERSENEQQEPDLETLHTLMRLLIGSTTEGTDELIRRLKEWQKEIGQTSEATMVISPDETELDRLRYAFIGFLFESPRAVIKGVSTVDRTARKATGLMSKLFSPVTNSRLMRPARDRYEKMAMRGESILENWIQTGRAEEQLSRILVKRGTSGVIDEFLQYMAENPEVRTLVQQQSIGMADEVLGEVRNRTASADTLVERVARSILRLPPRESQPSSTMELPADTASEQVERK